MFRNRGRMFCAPAFLCKFRIGRRSKTVAALSRSGMERICIEDGYLDDSEAVSLTLRVQHAHSSSCHPWLHSFMLDISWGIASAVHRRYQLSCTNSTQDRYAYIHCTNFHLYKRQLYTSLRRWHQQLHIPDHGIASLATTARTSLE